MCCANQIADDGISCIHQIEANKLRADVGYWRKMHARAVQRCKFAIQIAKKLKARIKGLERKLFGKKSEKSKLKSEDVGADMGAKKPERGRGKQFGSKGNGRKTLDQLPAIEENHDLPESEKCCSKCKKPFDLFPGTEDSEEIEIEVKVFRKRIRRKRYRPTCKCKTNPGIITAPGPAKLIPKGKFGISVWVMALLTKFYWQRPTHRFLHELEAYGLPISQGTITGGFKKLALLLTPVAQAIGKKNRSEHHWHADETRWMVFVQIEGKIGNRWYLWVFQSAMTVFFKIVQSRGSKVAKEHFGEDAWGIISADRYSAYKALIKSGRFLIAFCWAHVRRDFVDLAKDWSQQEEWALTWVEKIGALYDLNEQRLAYDVKSEEFKISDGKLKKAADQMAADTADSLKNLLLHSGCRKVLESLQNHWSGLILFVKYPWIPMDNNTAERTLRNPVVGRKNYYGSGAEWSAQLNADALSITQTLALWGINPRLWFMEFFETCAKNGGKALASIDSFLPWNLSMEKLKEFGADPDRIPKAKPDFKMENQACVHASDAVKKIQRCHFERSEKSLISTFPATISQGFSSVKAKNYLLPHCEYGSAESTVSLIDST